MVIHRLSAACGLLVGFISALASASGSAGSYEVKSFNLPILNCAHSDCFTEAVEELKPWKLDLDTYAAFPETPRGVKALSQVGHLVKLTSHKSPVVVLFVHGLYGNSYQFTHEMRVLSTYGINSVSVTLPGHGLFYKLHEQLTYKDWQEQLFRSYQFAQALGDKVVMVGQSTGGLLAYGLSLDKPSNLAGLVLIEPAFEVQKYLKYATCLTKGVFSKAQDLSTLARVLRPGIDLSDELPISLNMGCEVSRLGESLIQRFSGAPFKKSKYLLEWQVSAELEFLGASSYPTLIAYSQNDDVVGTWAMDQFVKLNPKTVELYRLDQVNLEGGVTKVYHGSLVQSGVNQIRQGSNGTISLKSNPLLKFLATQLALRNYFDRFSYFSYFQYSYEGWLKSQKSNIKHLLEFAKIADLEFTGAEDLLQLLPAPHEDWGRFSNSIAACKLMNPKQSKYCELPKVLRLDEIENDTEILGMQYQFASQDEYATATIKCDPFYGYLKERCTQLSTVTVNDFARELLTKAKAATRSREFRELLKGYSEMRPTGLELFNRDPRDPVLDPYLSVFGNEFKIED